MLLTEHRKKLRKNYAKQRQKEKNILKNVKSNATCGIINSVKLVFYDVLTSLTIQHWFLLNMYISRNATNYHRLQQIHSISRNSLRLLFKNMVFTYLVCTIQHLKFLDEENNIGILLSPSTVMLVPCDLLRTWSQHYWIRRFVIPRCWQTLALHGRSKNGAL